jgi:hypothetical protein
MDPLYPAGNISIQATLGATVDGKKISLKSWDVIKLELKHQGKTHVLR